MINLIKKIINQFIKKPQSIHSYCNEIEDRMICADLKLTLDKFHYAISFVMHPTSACNDKRACVRVVMYRSNAWFLIVLHTSSDAYVEALWLRLQRIFECKQSNTSLVVQYGTPDKPKYKIVSHKPYYTQSRISTETVACYISNRQRYGAPKVVQHILVMV